MNERGSAGDVVAIIIFCAWALVMTCFITLNCSNPTTKTQFKRGRTVVRVWVDSDMKPDPAKMHAAFDSTATAFLDSLRLGRKP